MGGSRARSRSRYAVAGVAGIAAAVLLTVLGLRHYRDLRRWYLNTAHGVPVVKTWGDLRRARTFELEDGVRVRLGIEGTSAAAGGGVLLYGLVEGWQGQDRGLSGRLGPLRARALPESGEAETDAVMEVMHVAMIRSVRAAKLSGEVLYARSILLPEAGEYRAEISTKDGILRTAYIGATKGSFHPWAPWDEPGSSQQGLQRLGEPNTVRIANPAGGRAAPVFDGIFPVAVDEKDRTRLPVLFPAEPDPDLVLEASPSGDVLSLTAKEKPFAGSAFRWHFLTRWWVNGRPWRPEGSIVMSESIRSLHPTPEKRIRFLVDFDPARLGARSGDHIGVELLYAEQGWEEISVPHVEMLYLGEGHSVRRTNRAEFTVP